ncbi:hypothetical protein EVAR_33228_1 [Eumeta japonica]|uniref:Uncharacterized protein n=1 Tax=Eumeta variegata TaxID=151549 RepID=A0A4C1W255_EUMVA|nr:hypothetical protein EVAR_33228_1 [Eumeta japonica]
MANNKTLTNYHSDAFAASTRSSAPARGGGPLSVVVLGNPNVGRKRQGAGWWGAAGTSHSAPPPSRNYFILHFCQEENTQLERCGRPARIVWLAVAVALIKSSWADSKTVKFEKLSLVMHRGRRRCSLHRLSDMRAVLTSAYADAVFNRTVSARATCQR